MGLTHQDGISVYGSGFYWGKKGSEIGPIVQSGYITSAWVTGSSLLDSAVITANIAAEAVTFAKLGSGIKVVGGSIGVSGALLSVSTALSSITSIQCQLKHVVSGLITTKAIASGHCFDAYTYTDLGGASDLSTPVYWFALGQ